MAPVPTDSLVSAFNAPSLVVAPVPPFASPRVPVTGIASYAPDPSKVTAVVESSFVFNDLAVASFVAVAALRAVFPVAVLTQAVVAIFVELSVVDDGVCVVEYLSPEAVLCTPKVPVSDSVWFGFPKTLNSRQASPPFPVVLRKYKMSPSAVPALSL